MPTYRVVQHLHVTQVVYVQAPEKDDVLAYLASTPPEQVPYHSRGEHEREHTVDATEFAPDIADVRLKGSPHAPRPPVTKQRTSRTRTSVPRNRRAVASAGGGTENC